MDIIQLLPDHIANQIAAGEVIQRPSSAVKELLENAIDSGANKIQLYIKDSGKTLLQVIDNGCGMSKKDIQVCFERHATSKIKKADDLFNIKTMGFRGEALSSIAAISHVSIESKLTNNETGTRLEIEGGEIQKQEECMCQNGTSIKIKNLFYNVPARRKFLKSEKVEMRHITEEFTRIALANPEIRMQLFHNKNELFHLEKNNFRQRIVNIIGGRKNEALVPIQEDISLVNISGFIGKPESAKRTRGEQYFFVNNRFVKLPYLHHAISKAFEGLIPSNYFPSYFINLKISPSLIDINIHPTKTEIQFKDEKSIYAIIRSTVKRSLGEYNIAPSIDFSQEVAFNIEYNDAKNRKIKEPHIKIDNSYNPFDEEKEIIQKDISYEKSAVKTFKQDHTLAINQLYAIQINNKYIAFPSEDGLLLIHQSRAHKRILFEDIKNKLEKNNGKPQKLLFPQEIKINKKDMSILIDIRKNFKKIGFEFKQIDDEIISFTAIPLECKEKNLKGIIEYLIEQYKNNENLQTQQKKELAIKLANSLAIHEIKTLNIQEMISLKNQLLNCDSPTICPLGNRTMINIKNTELEKYF